jgi:hypothetical protein
MTQLGTQSGPDGSRSAVARKQTQRTIRRTRYGRSVRAGTTFERIDDLLPRLSLSRRRPTAHDR